MKYGLCIFKIVCVLIVTIIAACDSEPSDSSRFDYDLRGIWHSNDQSVYAGELVIDFDRITILGYEEIQTPPYGDDSRRPFKDFTKGTPLLGYSEGLFLFIRDAGEWYEIPYTYYSENLGRDRFLRLTFGERNETLRRSQ